MATYEVVSPDGKKYEVTAPDGASEAEVLAYAKQNFGKTESAIGAFGSGAARGAVDQGAGVAGAYMGGKLGLAFGGPIGGALGAGGGYFAGQYAAPSLNALMQKLGLQGKESDYKETKPYYKAGEVLGGSVPYMVAPYAAAKNVPLGQHGRTIVEKIIHGAANNPGKFAAGELTMAGNAAAARGASEALFPDNEVAGMAAEIAGGTIAPTSLIARFAGRTIDSARRIITSQTKAGKESEASKLLWQYLSSIGEDPEAIAKQLVSEGIEGVHMSAAEKSGSTGLAALQKKYLAPGSIKGDEAAAQSKTAAEKISGLIDAMAATGDPQALKDASVLRKAWFDATLQSRILSAEKKFGDAASKFPKGDSAALGKQARDAISDVLNSARTREDELWKAVDQAAPATPENLSATIKELRGRRWPGQPLDGADNIVVAAERGIPEFSTVGNLANFRSDMLKKMRAASSAKNYGDADIYSRLADAALEDMSSTGQGAAVDAARDFSRSLHDTFSRTFAGDALSRSSTGASRIAPEIMLDRAFSGPDAAANMRMTALRDASRFMGDGTPVRTMASAQEDFLRGKANELLDPVTGRVSEQKLAKFREKYGSTIESFPQLKADLGDAQSASSALAKTEAMAARADAASSKYAAFAKIANAENPVEVVGKALSSPKEYTSFVKTARRGGSPAIDGLRSATIDAAMQKATRNDASVDFNALDRILRGAKRGEQSTLSNMRMNGVIDRRGAELLDRLIDNGQRLQRAAEQGKKFDDVMGGTDAIFDLASRLVGSNVASVASFSHTSPLIAGAAGSKAARNLFDKVPTTKIGDVITDALRDPQKMAMLLQKYTPSAGRGPGVAPLRAYLIQSGLAAPESFEE